MSDKDPAFNNPSNLPEFTAEEFERFSTLLHQKCGMYFDENKLGVVRTVIQERMIVLGLSDYFTYYRVLAESPTTQTLEYEPGIAGGNYRRISRELRRVVERLAVNETAFFRNREHYKAISEEVLPRLFRRNAEKKHLRLWSAGCSTGQEPYSLAMATVEALQQNGQSPSNWKIEIIASDISERALWTAHTGRYRNEELRGLGQEQIGRFFRPLSAPTVATAPLDPSEIYKPGKYQISRHRPRPAYEISPQIREMVTFYYFNLTSPTYPADKFSGFDLVLCENVTIYFTTETTRKVIQNIYQSMNEGAFLFIGYSETLWQISDRFKLINTQDTFYYQKPYPNEDPSRYVRRMPATGPLSVRNTDALKSPPPSEGTESRRITDPLQQKGATSPAPAPASPPKPVTPPVSPVLKPTLLKRVKPAEPPPPPPPARDWRELLKEGQSRMAEHEFDQALALLEKALVAAPHEVEVLCTVARLKLQLGDYTVAAQLCQLAITQDQLCEPAHLMLAMIHHKEGRIEQAIQEYKHTIYINLEAVIAYMRLADIFRDTGRQRDALREYKRALSVLQQKAPDEIIEDLSVGLLMQACQQNITRLSPRKA